MSDVSTHNLPEDLARKVEAHIATGDFADAEDVLRASLEALDERQQKWLAYLQREAAEGFAELDRGVGVVRGTAAEMIALLRSEMAEREKD